ncbi:hypothetical protein IV203_013414 [Nitzschia inconspicua]|uniref:Uncharacterized protein n=1 Tax=Nitzschia inconspicua TaxID=303405 RepID=A0A9K3M5M9_9STRA|nr:hypothetical protein IV203_013414 [Nitzschia inconspicua]
MNHRTLALGARLPKVKRPPGTRPSEARNRSQVHLLSQKLQRMMDIERHHIISISNHDEDDIDLFRTWIDWCPKYEAVPGARGGKGLLHHVCRRCRKVCFHLLDKSDGVKQRLCLGCWVHCHDKNLLPNWYYHSPLNCNICKKTAKP